MGRTVVGCRKPPRSREPRETCALIADAPVDLQTYGGGAELRYDAALDQDGAIGRFFLVGATYTF
jgi:hypothetical protein